MNNILTNKKRFIFSFLFSLFSFLLLIIAYFYYQIKIPLAKNGTEKTIVIEKGESIKEIAQDLEKVNLIKGSFYFELYVFLKNLPTKISKKFSWARTNLQAGEYLLSPSMNIPQIIEILATGKVVRHEVKITIPEGFTLKQIDERLTQVGLIQPDQLISFNPNNLPVPSLEGYLFPDTYIFNKKTTLEEIVKKMLDNFNKKLTEQMKEEIERQDKTIEQIIILASIVQQEAFSNQEMPKLAGVFYNRLKRNMPLQSDATVNYITGKKLRQPTIEDTKIASSYNTYLHQGLPPGPISNPGIEAIRASIWPEKTEYFYFLHPLDGPTIFSKTEEEHFANKAKWLR